MGASSNDVEADAKIKATAGGEIGHKSKRKVEAIYNGLAVIDYNAVRLHIEALAENIGAECVIVLIDEWSDILRALQPLVAEMIRKTLGTS
ncbi:MAG: hypothetical protein JOZ17_26590, partial [Acetobacteraceae bacterium]|nr:hypothetical protein [Acetobacteraceae bacterium]